LKKLLYSSHGGALLITLSILLMLTIAAIMAVHTAQTDIELSFNQLHYDKAFYVAEAGLKQAFLKLNENNQWDSVYTGLPFEDGAFTVVVTRPVDVDSVDYDAVEDRVTVRATGIVEKAHANLRADIVPELYYPFQYAMYGDEFVQLVNNTCTDSYDSELADYDTYNDLTAGDVASNGTITLTNAADVGGDATSSVVGGVLVDPTSTVSQTVTDGVEPFVLDPIPVDTFVYYADPAHNDNDLLLTTPGYDNVTYNLTLGLSQVLTLASGVYYFVDITLLSNSSIVLAPGAEVTIYTTGTLTLNNNTSINAGGVPADLLILSSGTVAAVGNDTEICAAFYGPDADVTLDNSCDWFGSLITNSATLKNTGCVHYDEALAGKATATTGKMLMASWVEE
jgi:hypothetical protein